MKEKEISDVIFNYVYSKNYSNEFINHEKYINDVRNNKFNMFSEAYGILNNIDETKSFIKKYILHEDGFQYYFDNAEYALTKEKDPNKALFIVDHILDLDKTNNALLSVYLFKSRCYEILKEHVLVIFCTDQIIKLEYESSIEKSEEINIRNIYDCFLKPRVKARQELNQLLLAMQDCKRFLDLIITIKGKENTIYSADVYELISELFESRND